MKTMRWFLAGIGAVSLGGFAMAAGQAGQASLPAAPTYTKDVAPILFKNCTSCHRPGEIAPMSLLTYEDVRPYAKDIRDEVERGTHAAVARGGAEGDVPERARTDRRREEDAARVGEHGRGEGRPEGPAADARLSRGLGHRQAGRRLRDAGGLHGSGRGRRSSTSTSTSRPTSPNRSGSRRSSCGRATAKSCITRSPSTGRRPTCTAPAGTPAEPEQMALPPAAETGHAAAARGSDAGPASSPPMLPARTRRSCGPGTAIRLEPGGVIELQMHYTANGKAAKDRTRVGLMFAKDPAPREVRVTHFMNGTLVAAGRLTRHARRRRHHVRQRRRRLGHLPAHARARQEVGIRARAAGRNEEERPVGADYDFNWQTYYMFTEPLQVPKGSRLVSSAWYDNSAANKSNPDPKVDVKWGDQTWEEMQYTGLLFSPGRGGSHARPPGGGVR